MFHDSYILTFPDGARDNVDDDHGVVLRGGMRIPGQF